MSLFRRKGAPAMDRSMAMGLRPVKMPILDREELGEGRVRVRAPVEAPRWMRWLGSSRQVERTFGLDALGREVYDMCDGSTDVRSIVGRFAGAHSLSPAEAELSVSTFLSTLMRKGLVAMVSEEEREGDDG